VDVRTLQGLLGHSDLSVTEQYLDLARADEKREYLASGGPAEGQAGSEWFSNPLRVVQLSQDIKIRLDRFSDSYVRLPLLLFFQTDDVNIFLTVYYFGLGPIIVKRAIENICDCFSLGVHANAIKHHSSIILGSVDLFLSLSHIFALRLGGLSINRTVEFDMTVETPPEPTAGASINNCYPTLKRMMWYGRRIRR
jgi:hypothetical protein